MTLKAITIALVCGTAQAGYSISSMLTTRRKKTPGSAGSIRGAAAPADGGPSEEIEALAGESFDWLANLGAPAALVAGAIMATLVEQGDFLKTTPKDTELWARYMKRSAHVLLITALAMSLLGNAPAAGGKATTWMRYFIGTSLLSTLLLMISFLNKHMNFYASYLHMIADFHLQFFQQYFLCTPVRKPNSPHAIDAISTQVHARPPDGVARGGGLHALVQVLLRGHYGRRR